MDLRHLRLPQRSALAPDPPPHPRLVRRAVTWTATLLLISGNHPIVVLLRAPARTAAVVGPLLGLGCTAVPVRDTDPGRFTLFFSVLSALTVVVGAYPLLLPLQSVQRVRELRAVRTAERLELARELHDLVAHHVTGIVVEARAARFTHVSAQRAAEILGRIETAGDEALGSMRRLDWRSVSPTTEAAPPASATTRRGAVPDDAGQARSGRDGPGGSLTAGPAPERGWLVTAVLPL
ncbi:histidine kinase [Streptomyces sp. NPDC057686]|uniref:histidine kinase n=1 Tax=Streptomyces sp. NPDC057686 TaxID=3346212 RepID=UPI0036AFD856